MQFVNAKALTEIIMDKFKISILFTFFINIIY